MRGMSDAGRIGCRTRMWRDRQEAGFRNDNIYGAHGLGGADYVVCEECIMRGVYDAVSTGCLACSGGGCGASERQILCPRPARFAATSRHSDGERYQH